MSVLYGLVALFGAITLLNLLLTFGIIRRLRQRPATGSATYPGMLPSGSLVGDFTARDLLGQPLSRADLDGRTLIGFFSPGCDACTEQLPAFVAAARSVGPRRCWAVVTGDAESASPYLPSLEPVARVVLENEDDSLLSAFSVQAFPSFFVVDATGRVVAGGVAVDDLPVAAAA
ncbi:TlpA family protein disulfide reductase [Actinoplanes xinjiangensis]|uniref:TlpA family protein disulfide reductase n=1 Tax=Actinoplanes xinjiangensis TaxID=512350 RepID=UPI00341ED7A3